MEFKSSPELCGAGLIRYCVDGPGRCTATRLAFVNDFQSVLHSTT